MRAAFVRRSWSTLKPADEESERRLRENFPLGKVQKIKWSEARNWENHKRFFAFLRAAFPLQNKYDDIEIFRKVILVGAGHFDMIQKPNGDVFLAVRSIAFDKLDELDFKPLFKKCVEYFLETFGENLTEKQLLMIMDFL